VAVELAELIGQLRSELTVAMGDGASEELRFELGPVELELALEVSKEATAGAKVRFWVVDASTDGKLASKSTQKIKLTLDPRLASQPGRKPLISGDEDAGERDDEG
jgi:hypothetical protein